MKQQKSILRLSLTGIIGAALLLNTLFTLIPVVAFQPLKGFTKPRIAVSLTTTNWLDGSYQEYKEQQLADSSYLLPFLVRLHNEIEFYTFSKIHVASIMEGQEGYLYDREDIAAYCGSDFVGKPYVEDQIRKLKFIEEQLRPFGKKLVVVLAPGKSSMTPEYLPATVPAPGKITNLSEYQALLKKERIPHIDFSRYFKQLKRSSAYPLYSKFGVHWSNYAAALAADSILRYVEHAYGIDIANCTWSKVKQQSAHGTDIDFLESLNLLHYPDLPQLGYPRYQYVPAKSKPPFLGIGDSFYWGLPEFNTPFSNYHFWFYNNEVYPETSYSSLFTYQLDLKAELAKHDIILILASESNLKDIGWGAINRLADALKKPETLQYLRDDYATKISTIVRDISSIPEWKQLISQKAAEKHISVDSMLTLDAKWVYHQYEEKKTK